MFSTGTLFLYMCENATPEYLNRIIYRIESSEICNAFCSRVNEKNDPTILRMYKREVSVI